MISCRERAIAVACSILVSLCAMEVSGDSASEGLPASDIPSQRPDDQPPEKQQDHWEVVNNSRLSVERRAEAERALIDANDVRMLRIAFRGLAEPIEVIHLPEDADGDLRLEHVSVLGGMGLFAPTIGSLEGDARAGAPVAAQIAYARSRVWYHLARNAEPEEDRKSVYEELIEEAMLLPRSFENDLLLQTLISNLSRNWTPGGRKQLLSIYQNPDRPTRARASAGGIFLNLRHATPLREYRAAEGTIIGTAWTERGGELARRMGQRLRAKDPRVSVLKLDWYETELDWARQAGRLPNPLFLDELDRYFGNVSRLYINSRSAEGQRRWPEYRDRRTALREEARETGNDSKLREFEAETAAQQQAELELRIERIDAWIARHRDRLEREAETYHRERLREERKQTDE